MALSGIVKKDFHKNGVFTLQIEWEATQNIANNTSTITARMYLISNVSGTISSSVDKVCRVVIDGVTYTNDDVKVSISSYQKKLLATFNHTITHNPDGTRNFIISGSLDINVTLSGTYYGTISITGATFTLDTIPRASTISSFPNFTIGNSFTVTINRASSSFTHKLELKYGSTLIATRTGIGASTTFTLSAAEENVLYAVMKNVTSGTVTLYCTTYSGGTKIGSTTSKTATASVSSSIVPSFDTLTHSDVSTDISSVFGAYIQGKSRLNLAITGAAGAKYSTIVAYKIEFNQEVYNARTAVSGYIKSYGNITIKGTVTDSRGRSYSKTITINVLAYSAPKISSFRVDRCDEDGTLNSSGEYAKVTVSGEYKSLNGHNTILLTIHSKPRNVSSYTSKHTDTPDPAFAEEYVIGVYDISTSYDFKIELEDYFESAESIVVLGTAKVVLDLGREGVGIGKYHENGALDINGDIYINGYKFIHKSILVELNAAQTIPNNTNTFVNLGIIRRQYGSVFSWNASNPSRVYVGAGVSKVRVRAQVGWFPNETGNRQLYIYKNGSGVFYPYLSETVKAVNALISGLFGTVQSIYSPVLPVQEGDYFEMMVRQNSGGSLNITQNNGATGLYLEAVE